MNNKEEIMKERFNQDVCSACSYHDTCKVKNPNKCDVLNNG